MAKITLFIFALMVFSLTFPSFAQEELTIKEATDSPEFSSINKNINKSVEYQLPYPGLLPDNPLYFSKALRDRVVDFLISDPLKKADFYLLQADKRLNAGVYLFKTGKSKYNLAESTISKGENYFEKAIEKAKEAKKQAMDIKDIASRLLTSSKKHQEVLNEMAANADLKTKQSLMSLVKRVADFEKQAEALTAKK